MAILTLIFAVALTIPAYLMANEGRLQWVLWFSAATIAWYVGLSML